MTIEKRSDEGWTTYDDNATRGQMAREYAQALAI